MSHVFRITELDVGMGGRDGKPPTRTGGGPDDGDDPERRRAQESFKRAISALVDILRPLVQATAVNSSGLTKDQQMRTKEPRGYRGGSPDSGAVNTWRAQRDDFEGKVAREAVFTLIGQPTDRTGDRDGRRWFGRALPSWILDHTEPTRQSFFERYQKMFDAAMVAAGPFESDDDRESMSLYVSGDPKLVAAREWLVRRVTRVISGEA